MVDQQIKLLRQIQHLVLIRAEEAKLSGGERTEELTEAIAKLVSGLEPEAATLRARLSKRGPIFMSAVSKGNCSVCGMKLPTSVLQHVLAKSRLVVCQGCGRILYAPEVKSTGIRAEEPDPKFPLSRFSDPALMLPSLMSRTMEGAIAEMALLLGRCQIVSDPQALAQAALERETILTTAVGNGLAFPHMRGVEEGVLTFAAGVSKAGIDWNGQKVHLVIFSTFPVAASPFYLRLLAAFAKAFEDGEKLPFLLAANDAPTLWKEFNKATRTVLKDF